MVVPYLYPSVTCFYNPLKAEEPYNHPQAIPHSNLLLALDSAVRTGDHAAEVNGEDNIIASMTQITKPVISLTCGRRAKLSECTGCANDACRYNVSVFDMSDSDDLSYVADHDLDDDEDNLSLSGAVDQEELDSLSSTMGADRSDLTAVGDILYIDSDAETNKAFGDEIEFFINDEGVDEERPNDEEEYQDDEEESQDDDSHCEEETEDGASRQHFTVHNPTLSGALHYPNGKFERREDSCRPTDITGKQLDGKITEYEAKRQQIIAKNEALLRDLRLEFQSVGLLPEIRAGEKREYKPRQKGLKPTRRSIRIQEKLAALAFTVAAPTIKAQKKRRRQKGLEPPERSVQNQGKLTVMNSRKVQHNDDFLRIAYGEHPRSHILGRSLFRTGPRVSIPQPSSDDSEDELGQP
jgi:hypothetical protein